MRQFDEITLLPQCWQRISELFCLLFYMYLTSCSKVNLRTVITRGVYLINSLEFSRPLPYKQKKKKPLQLKSETLFRFTALPEQFMHYLLFSMLVSALSAQRGRSPAQNSASCADFVIEMGYAVFILKQAAMEPARENRLLRLVLGAQLSSTIASSSVLVVGAGGTGCELVKNLAKSGYKSITLLDFDSIETTNLNRQFYFRKEHVGRGKSETVRSVLLNLDPSVKIEAINASVYERKFNQSFYKKFDVVFSCLDNMKAREHLAAQATKFGKPLVDTGTMSYFGQTYSSVRFRTSCHNCSPSRSEQAAASCTIRSHPHLPLHCATYAKNFYDSFFGLNHAEALSEALRYARYAADDLTDQEIGAIGEALFEEMFNVGIREVDLEGNRIDFVRKLSGREADELTEPVKNPESTFEAEEDLRQAKSPYREDKLWSICQYRQKFLSSTARLMKRKLAAGCPGSFDKDDEDCMTLVLCIANLRTYNFISHEAHNRHKYLTYYQCKDLIGKVFPAIASANAIAAALQAREALNLLAHRLDSIRYLSFGNRSDERISPSFQSAPSPECPACSEKVVYASVACDMGCTTFGQVEEFAGRHCFTQGRDVTSGAVSIVRASKRGGQQNRQQLLSSFPEMVHAGVLELQFLPQLHGPQFTVHLSVAHADPAPQIRFLEGGQSRSAIAKQLRVYFRRARSEAVSNHLYEVEANGGFEL